MSRHRGFIMFWAVAAFALMLTGCRTVKEIEIQYDTIVKTDTTEVYVHDTTKVTEIKYDSVDREVEKIIYVDSNGVWHEKEKETLTHYIFQQSEEYKVKEAEYKNKITDLEMQLAEKQKVEYVEKELNWWQKTFIGIGVVSLVALLCAVVWKTRKWWSKLI